MEKQKCFQKRWCWKKKLDTICKQIDLDTDLTCLKKKKTKPKLIIDLTVKFKVIKLPDTQKNIFVARGLMRTLIYRKHNP